METAGQLTQSEEWRKRAFLGPLPPHFLRIEDATSQEQQEAADHQAAYALHQMQMQSMPMMQDNRVGRLSVTVAQAKLVKNYGLTRMDPYVRLRVGHNVYETHTATSGGKNPHWNIVIQCHLPAGVNKIYVEIYDECSFTMDELIAWGHVEIPPQVVKNGETHEDWYMLSGKQGDNQEGMINLVLSFAPRGAPYTGASSLMIPSTTIFNTKNAPYAPVNVYTLPARPNEPGPPAVPASSLPEAETELKQISEMFPNIDNEVIKSVYDANNGKKDVTINSLLQMCE